MSHEERLELSSAVHRMHQAVVFYCRPTELQGPEYIEKLQESAAALHKYAWVAEGLDDASLCKSNLHLAVCRLSD
jgi:hypothetical protein